MSEQIKKTPILCLDLDGTVRHSVSGDKFIKDANDIAIFPGVAEILDEYLAKGWFIVGISNQGSIAHGIKTTEQVHDELRRTRELLPQIAIIRACPTMADGNVYPYNWRSLQRKPYYGMLASLEDQLLSYQICIPDWDNSLFVGDRPEDEGCAANADIPFEHADVFFKRTTKEAYLKAREEAISYPDFLLKNPISGQDISQEPVAATVVWEPEYTEIAGTAELLQDFLTEHNWGNYFRSNYPLSATAFSQFLTMWSFKNEVNEDFFNWPLSFQLGLLSEFAFANDGGWGGQSQRFFHYKSDFTEQLNVIRTFFIGLESWLLKHSSEPTVKEDTAFI
jgi:histidinol phosphatase-like enzyme